MFVASWESRYCICAFLLMHFPLNWTVPFHRFSPFSCSQTSRGARRIRLEVWAVLVFPFSQHRNAMEKQVSCPLILFVMQRGWLVLGREVGTPFPGFQPPKSHKGKLLGTVSRLSTCLAGAEQARNDPKKNHPLWFPLRGCVHSLIPYLSHQQDSQDPASLRITRSNFPTAGQVVTGGVQQAELF